MNPITRDFGNMSVEFRRDSRIHSVLLPVDSFGWRYRLRGVLEADELKSS